MRAGHTIALLLLASLLASPSTGLAAPPGSTHEISLRLTVEEHAREGDTREASRVRRVALLELARERLMRRVEAARIKDTKLTVVGDQLHITLRTRETRQWAASLLLAPGELGVHPLMPQGKLWSQLAAQLPAGVELRQPDDSMDPEDAYLWSTQSSLLERVAKRTALSQIALGVSPDADGGWRLLAYGPALATHQHVTRVSPESTSVSGEPFVSLGLAYKASADTPLAVVLDGEIIALTRASAEREGLQLACPVPGDIAAQRACVQLMAGRLGAHLPITLKLVSGALDD